MDNVNRIRVGFFAPTFELFDTEGKSVILDRFFGERIVFLVFFCNLEEVESQDLLRLVQERLEEIKIKGGVVLGISSAKKRELKKQKGKLKIDFPILSDENFSVISQYGIKSKTSEMDLCYPAVFVVDKEGLIRYRQVWVKEISKRDLDRMLPLLDELM